MNQLDHLHWEMSVLSRAVAYNNLSAAAAHIGLSQPQLSRIVAKLEAELKVMLLDREVKRKSSWTPLAQRLSETWARASRNLQSEVQRLVDTSALSTLRIGTLEGLSSLALSVARNALEKTSVKTLEIDVYDLSELEELFGRGDLDLILSFREPGRKKFKYSKRLGYQSLERVTVGKGGTRVMSLFEHGALGSRKKSSGGAGATSDEKVFISNSLALRRAWIETYGGVGIIPKEVTPARTGAKDEEIISLIASDQMNASVWEKVSSFRT